MEKIKRSTTLDIARGLGMVFIMIYHLVYRSQGGAVDQMIRESIWGLIPFFFIISGYFYDGKPGNVMQNIRKRARKIFIPVVLSEAALLVVFGVYFAVLHGYSFADWLIEVMYTYIRPELSNVIMRALGGPENASKDLFANLSPVWFIWTMCFTYLLFYPVAEFAIRSSRNFVISCVMLIAGGTVIYTILPPLSWGLHCVPAYTVIMLISYKVKTLRLYEKLAGLKVPMRVLIMLLAFFLHFVLFNIAGTDQMYAGEIGTVGWLSLMAYVLEAFIWAVAYVELAGFIRNIPGVNSLLLYVGRNSLTFLLTHAIFAIVAADAIHAYYKMGINWYLQDLTPEIIIKSVITMVFAFICCLAVSFVQEKYISVKKVN